MSKYYAISLCSHLALLGLLLLGSGKADRGETIRLDQKNIVIDFIPSIERMTTSNNRDSGGGKAHQRETKLSSNQNKGKKLEPHIYELNHNIMDHLYNYKSPKIDASGNNKESPKTKPVFSTFDTPPDEKLIAKKPPSFADTKVSSIDATQSVPQRETLIPIPKPEVQPDLYKKNRSSRDKVATSDSSTPKHAPAKNSSHKNTPTVKVTTNAILSFNKELVSQTEFSKNAQSSMKTMHKKNNNNNPLMSLHPNFRNDQAKHQCKLILRQKSKPRLNIRMIQNQIKSRSITISNILTHKPVRKPNEISISSLLASNSNITSHNQRRTSENIQFLLTANSLQDYADNLVCEPY